MAVRFIYRVCPFDPFLSIHLLSRGKCKTRFDALLIKPFLLMLESGSGFVSRQNFKAQRRVPLYEVVTSLHIALLTSCLAS